MMAKKTAEPKATPQIKGGKTQKNTFLIMALDMSWQLAVVVLVPVIGGAKLSKTTGTNAYLFVGLALAVVGSTAVMWRAMQAANRLPVPKLTPAERKKIQKQYEEEDED
ncbi:MAG TPA: hypothetical protein VFK11_03385 [Candidatus Saccharimonadales bacterium]|nr:hypothetical protein [Candidatus Saccharimonadales bacterium]